MEMLIPHEDVIIDGALAYTNFGTVANCIVSAMSLGGVSLLGVTPVDVSKAVSFEFAGSPTRVGSDSGATGSVSVGGSAAAEYTLLNLETGVSEMTNSSRVTFSATLAKTAVFLFSPT